MADRVASTPEQRQALAKQVLGVAAGVLNVPPHLRLLAAPIAEAILAHALSDDDAQDKLAKVERIGGLALQLFEELKS